MAKVYIGLCSNIGNTAANIAKALELLKERCNILQESSLYDTAPWGVTNQEWFLNSEVLVETTLSPQDLLVLCKAIEKKMQRKKTVRNGPRIIDLDIHFYEDVVMESEKLTIPHPRFHLRLANLIPLDEMCPEKLHVRFGKTTHELTEDMKKKEKGWEQEIKKR